MRRRAADLVFGRLARVSIWMSLAGVLSGILGYVFQVVMGRMLSPVDYGVFSAIMALFAFLSAPASTLLMVVARKVAEYRSRGDVASTAHFYFSISARTAVAGAAMLAVFLLFAPQVQAYLRTVGPAPVYLLGLLVLVNFHPVINNAFLQGMQRFGWLSTTSALSVLLKIVMTATLVALGFGVSGAVGGICLSAVATWFMTYAAIHRTVAQGRGQSGEVTHLSVKQSLPVLAATASFAAMTQLDMVMVNYLFPPHDAGLYAAASVLGKAVLYLPGGIAMALFPMVAENHARNEASAHLLFQAVGLTSVLCTLGALLYFVLGEWIISLLYGASYNAAGPILRYFGFAILPMSLVLVAEHFLIAKGQVLFAYLFAMTAPLQLVAMYLWHPSLFAVLVVMVASGLVVMSLGYGILWRSWRR